MKVKSEDILKPGVELKVIKIDFNDPEVKRQIAVHHAECRKLNRINSQRYPRF